MNERTNQPKTFDEWWEAWILGSIPYHADKYDALEACWLAATAAAQAEIAGLRLNLQSVVKRSETNDEAYRAALRAKDEEIARLREAAGHLAWATEVEIQGGTRTRSFIHQHREKCRFWIKKVRELESGPTAQAEKEKP